METFAPDSTQLLLMASAFIVVVILFIWRSYAPRRMRSKLVFDSEVKRTWLLLASEDQKVAFTHLVLDAVKSDGKITGDEAEAIYEGMTIDYKHKASEMEASQMFEILKGCDAEQKDAINGSLRELLISDGDFDPKEKAWLDEVQSKLG